MRGVGFTAVAAIFMLTMSGLAYAFGRILPTQNKAELGSWVRGKLWVPPFLVAVFLLGLDVFVVVARTLGYKIAGE